MEQRVDNIETWMRWLLRGFGVTLVGLLAFAFWLGTISNDVSTSKQMTTKVYSAVLEDPNSLSVRVGVIEHRLTGIESRLTALEGRMTNVEDRLNRVDNRLILIDEKLDRLLSRRR